MSEREQPGKMMDLQDVAWVMSVGSRAGLMLALPVLLGLAVGYLLDRYSGTLPWITLFFTLAGTASGPVLVYRLVTRAVHDHLEGEQE